MPQLFAVPKMGVYLDTITHATEKRRDGEVKVVRLTCRVQPFERAHAGTVREDVKTTLFSAGLRAEARPHLERVGFRLGLPRQHLTIYASPDTEQPSLRIEHAKITGIYARTQKDVNGYAFVFQATFGPASAAELAYVEAWRTTQRFVSVEEAEPSLAFDQDVEEDEDDAPEPPAATPPLPMWDEDDGHQAH